MPTLRIPRCDWVVITRYSPWCKPSVHQVAPGKIGFDPLVSLGKGLDHFKCGDVDDQRFAFGLADGIQTIAVLGPFKADAVYFFAINPRPEWADHFLADHAQQTSVFITLVDAVTGCLIDQCSKLLRSPRLGAFSNVADLPERQFQFMDALTFACVEPRGDDSHCLANRCGSHLMDFST